MREKNERPAPDYLTPPAVARMLGCAPDSIVAYIRRGQLRAVNLGHAIRPRWRIHRDDLRAWLDSRSNQRPAMTPARRPSARPLRQHV